MSWVRTDLEREVRPYHYGSVLGLILTSLAFQLATPDRGWARLVAILLQGAALLLALWVSRMRRILLRAAMVVVAVAAVTVTVVLLGTGDLGPVAGRSVTLLFVGLAPAAIAVGIVRDVRASGGVTVKTMFGVLCIYLLVGSFFAFCYGLVGELGSSAFFARDISGTQSDFLYFSFATLTTVGYGDLTAATDVGRSLAITEALIGQIYLVTVVAVIVSNLGRTRARRGDA